MRYFKVITHYYVSDRVEFGYHEVEDGEVQDFLFSALDCDVYGKDVSHFEINPHYWRGEHRFVEVLELMSKDALNKEKVLDIHHHDVFLKS